MGLAGVRYRQSRMHVGTHATCGTRGPHLAQQCITNHGLLRDRARPHRRAGDGQAIAHHRTEIDFRARTALEGDEHQPAVAPQYAQVPRDVVAPDHVEHHVHALARRQLLHPRREVFGTVVDGSPGAEPAAETRLFLIAHGHDALRAAERRQVDRRQADAAGAAVDQHPLARRQATQLHEIGPDRKPGFRHAGGLLGGHCGRNRQHLAHRGLAELRVAAPGRQGADRLTHLPVA